MYPDEHPSDRYRGDYVPAAANRKRWLRPVFLFLGAFVLGGLVLPNLHVSWRPPDSAAQRPVGLNITTEKTPLLSEAES